MTESDRKAAAAAKSRAYRAANPDKVAATMRRNYEKNRETRLAYAAQPETRAKKAARMKAARAADPVGSRLKFQAWNYSLSVDRVRELLEAGCAACGSAERLHIDHDHACCPNGSSPRSCGECVRGVLCHGCNTALGLVGESPDRLRMLIAYIGRKA